jgi:glycosyltransferase involved in cell wall biosynthesis
MTTTPTLCVYSIFLNESTNVGGWVDTVADADCAFVLDTGSTDDTCDQLDRAGVRYETARFDPFRFDDARNTSLALAPPADLYWKIDADERLPPDWRDRLNAVYDPAVPRYRYRLRNRGGGSWGTLIRSDIHARAGARWKYPIHESLDGPGPTLDVPGLTVDNHPSAARPDYTNRYLELLERAVQEYPTDHRMAFYFARECWYRNQWDRCRQAMTRFLDLPNGWPMERAEAFRILGAIDTYPDRWFWKAVAEAPERRECWVDLVRFYLRRGDVKAARAVLTFAQRATDDSLYTTQADCWGEDFDRLVEALS